MPHVNPSLTVNDVHLIPKMATSHVSLLSRIHNATELQSLKGNYMHAIQVKPR